MKLKLKRDTRTPYSEEISIYDLDHLDSDEEPVQIGKLDVHYVEDQIVGTLLIAQEFAEGYVRTQGGANTGQAALDEVISAVLAEVSEPIGVSATYAVEVYYPSFAAQGFFSNYGDEKDDDDGESYSDELEDEEEEYGADGILPPLDTLKTPPSTLFPDREDDDYTRRLRER